MSGKSEESAPSNGNNAKTFRVVVWGDEVISGTNSHAGESFPDQAYFSPRRDGEFLTADPLLREGPSAQYEGPALDQDTFAVIVCAIETAD